METRVSVGVETKTDSFGVETPLRIIWKNNKIFNIDRVLHTSCSKNGVKYIVLIQDHQRKLFKEFNKWYVQTQK